MNFQDIVNKFSTTPFLFVGSGISRRYYNLPDWKGLLQIFIQRLSSDEFSYNKYLNKAEELCAVNKHGDTLSIIAGLVMRDFDERWYSDESFRNVNENYKHFIHENHSPFKVEIAQYIETHSYVVEEKKEELNLLKEISCKSLAGIITTNYDLLLEKETDGYKTFVGQEELVFSALQGWAEIYKIHGSITDPNSIIITNKDYNYFRDYCPYLAAKLLTIFMEYPIIFMGYSLNDPNVRILLQELAKCLSPQNLEKLQNRFIYIEWEQGKDDIEVFPTTMSVDEKVIYMTRIKTDNFTEIYHILSTKKSKIPAKVLRMLKQEFYTYSLTNNPSSHLRIASIDDERVGDDDLILAIGKPSYFALQGLAGLSAKRWYQHIVLHDLEFTADEILTYAYPSLISKNNTLPLNMLLKEAKENYPKCEEKKCKFFDETINSTIRKQRDSKYIQYRNVEDIVNRSDSIEKAMHDIAYLKENEINIDQLENFLKNCFLNETTYDILSSPNKSNLHRLVRIYDFLKYGN